ncbi:hypothetical protein E2C01_023147 [Portunus trituberculatus]|uniref:Uncharacterized protein n=1 Tax=Portunus trituberculatus TaxID=210409 RepID=A0A5B7EAS3_PORTR|nr:hypothetical protein [Portunus trituberculatus]
MTGKVDGGAVTVWGEGRGRGTWVSDMAKNGRNENEQRAVEMEDSKRCEMTSTKIRIRSKISVSNNKIKTDQTENSQKESKLKSERAREMKHFTLYALDDCFTSAHGRVPPTEFIAGRHDIQGT